MLPHSLRVKAPAALQADGVGIEVYGSGKPQNGEVPLHSHDFAEFTLVLSGRGRHAVEAESYDIFAGDCFIVRGDQVHGISNAQKLERLHVAYDHDRLLRHDQELQQLPAYHALFSLDPYARSQGHFTARCHLDERDRQWLEAELLDIAEEQRHQRPGYRVVVSATFRTVLVRLCRAYEMQDSPSHRTMMRVGEVVACMERFFLDELRLEDFADVAGCSANHLNRLFKQVTGQTVVDYFIGFRIRKAQWMLSNTETPVLAVGESVGFHDANNFARHFRRVCGVSPARWRQEHADF